MPPTTAIMEIWPNFHLIDWLVFVRRERQCVCPAGRVLEVCLGKLCVVENLNT